MVLSKECLDVAAVNTLRRMYVTCALNVVDINKCLILYHNVLHKEGHDVICFSVKTTAHRLQCVFLTFLISY